MSGWFQALLSLRSDLESAPSFYDALNSFSFQKKESQQLYEDHPEDLRMHNDAVTFAKSSISFTNETQCQK